MTSSNPLRDLASLARDIRLIGQPRIPVNIERSCLIFVDKNAFRASAALFSAIRVAKFAKWANCEVYYYTDATVDEAKEAIQHFSANVMELSIIYFAGNPISQDVMDDKSVVRMLNGTIGPDLIYSLIDGKPEDLQLILLLDGINNPDNWNPLKHGLKQPHVTVIAPYPDPRQAHLQQQDLQNETLFIHEFWSAIKSKPDITAADIAKTVQKEIVDYGQKVYVESFPESDKNYPLVILG